LTANACGKNPQKLRNGRDIPSWGHITPQSIKFAKDKPNDRTVVLVISSVRLDITMPERTMITSITKYYFFLGCAIDLYALYLPTAHRRLEIDK